MISKNVRIAEDLNVMSVVLIRVPDQEKVS
jgi:hypothetical protein